MKKLLFKGLILMLVLAMVTSSLPHMVFATSDNDTITPIVETDEASLTQVEESTDLNEEIEPESGEASLIQEDEVIDLNEEVEPESEELPLSDQEKDSSIEENDYLPLEESNNTIDSNSNNTEESVIDEEVNESIQDLPSNSIDSLTEESALEEPLNQESSNSSDTVLPEVISVKVNGETCTMRGKKIRVGDRVDVYDEESGVEEEIIVVEG